MKDTDDPTTVEFGVVVKEATGGALTTTSRWAVAVNDSLSVTVSVTLNVPNVGYEWEMMAPLPFVRSPKSQTYESMVPSGSEEPDASKATVAPSITGFGVAVNDADRRLPESPDREIVGGV